MIFDRLAIGTANWGREYNGAKVSEDDQKRILDYCQCSGIDMIDTATAYEWDWMKVNSYFTVVVKATKDVVLREQDILIAHNIESYNRMEGANGISIYSPDDILEIGTLPLILQIPYSIYDRRFEQLLPDLSGYENDKIHVRSIFLRGKLLKEFLPFECISFCLMNPYIDRVIIGADSYEQFKENLKPFHRMNVAEKHDENLLDPRKWK